MENINKKIYKYLEKDYINWELDEAFETGLKNLKSLKVEEQDFRNYSINEEAISITLIISLMLAAPSLIENIAKSIGFLYKKIRKLFGKETDDSKSLQKLINITNKWHHAYIKTIMYIMKMAGIFKKAGVKNKKTQEKTAEAVFYVIIFGFAIHGGIATVESIRHAISHASVGHAQTATMEGIITALKTKEIKNFIATVIAS